MVKTVRSLSGKYESMQWRAKGLWCVMVECLWKRKWIFRQNMNMREWTSIGVDDKNVDKTKYVPGLLWGLYKTQSRTKWFCSVLDQVDITIEISDLSLLIKILSGILVDEENESLFVFEMKTGLFILILAICNE